ncbi:radical SAM protein, partial [Chloroflexota bacterium]
MTKSDYELGPIRPPSEAFSLLLRVTRNCPWNRCRFCNAYKGQRFELRAVEEVQADILAMKQVYDSIIAIARRAGVGDGHREIMASLTGQTLDGAERNVALWLHGDGNTAFLQDADSLIMPTDQLEKIIWFFKDTFPSIDRIT